MIFSPQLIFLLILLFPRFVNHLEHSSGFCDNSYTISVQCFKAELLVVLNNVTCQCTTAAFLQLLTSQSAALRTGFSKDTPTFS